MTRADLLVNLVKAGRQNDQEHIRRIVETMAAEERAKQHHILADRLLEQLRSERPTRQTHSVASRDIEHRYSKVITPTRTLNDLILDSATISATRHLIEEHSRAGLLRSYNVEPRHRILLSGPPGNGKTSLAEAIAEALYVPFIVIQYEGLIGSLLGETASRLASLFELARSQRCVLFLDEFDVLAKERGDIHESGEIKRLVSSLLLQIDDLPSHCIILAATNHPELLDRAAWRRFQIRLELAPPDKRQIRSWIAHFEQRIGFSLENSTNTLVSRLVGSSFSDLEEFGMNVYRQYVLNLPNSDLPKIIRSCLAQHESFLQPQIDRRASEHD